MPKNKRQKYERVRNLPNVTFPDPLPKQRTIKNRLSAAPFLDAYATQRTDWIYDYREIA